jgi:hypothetical protein
MYYAVNQKQLNNGQAMYNILVALVAAGWVCKGSGDGIANFSTTSNILTNGNSGSFGIWNASAWFRIQSPPTGPGGLQKREFCIQMGTAESGGSISARVAYSPNPTGTTGFTGGTPSATEVPSATDEVHALGGGTPASPTYAGWGVMTNYQFTQHIVCDNTGQLGYGFYVVQLGAQGQASTSNGINFALDVMLPGSARPNDLDPAVIYCCSADIAGYGASEMLGENTWGFIGGLASANWVNVRWYQLVTSGFPSGELMGSDAWQNQDPIIIPMWIWLTNTPAYPGTGAKGHSSLFKISGATRGIGFIMQLNPNADGEYIFLNGTLLPWPSKTPIFVN